jgi:hypothetical protein
MQKGLHKKMKNKGNMAKNNINGRAYTALNLFN